MQTIEGGITAPIGFTAAGIHCGVKASPLPDGNDAPDQTPPKKDLAMILSDCDCAVAAVYTKNVVKAAPVLLSKEHLKDGCARAVIVNSGNANACAPNGMEHAQAMARAAAKATDLQAEQFAVASTGVIGVELNIATIEAGIPSLVSQLSKEGYADAANAILTTDLTQKQIAVQLPLGGKTVTLGLMAKGSGMIHPNMGTTLCFCTTDCAIDAALLQKALLYGIAKTFNRVSVDGDTSTNDSCFVLANGLAGNTPLTEDSADFLAFRDALTFVLEDAAKKIAADGEGAGRLVTCTVEGAASEEQAEQVAKAVISSSLVKTAMFGADANWGRVVCAAGYSGVSFDPTQIAVRFSSSVGELPVCANGTGLAFDEALAKAVLSEPEVTILVSLQQGDGAATCWGCDLTYGYVTINGDYRN